MRHGSKSAVWVSATLFLAACGGKSPAGEPAAPAAAVQQLVLARDPGEALGVLAAKATGGAEHAIVHGRIAHVVPGHAVFTLMDTGLAFCGEDNAEDDCATPWDYCCESAETRTANSLLVEVRDAQGQPIATPALPGLRLLDTVKDAGKLGVDEHGYHVLVATGLFRTDRPAVPDGVRWPR